MVAPMVMHSHLASRCAHSLAHQQRIWCAEVRSLDVHWYRNSSMSV
jgi:hypothetical protein